MKCPSCGYENLAGADVCEQCQTSLTHEDIPRAHSDVERSLMEDPIVSLRPIKPLTVNRQDTLENAIRLMQHHGIGCVLITADDGKLTGILTERDLLQKVAGSNLALSQCRVEDYMTRAPETGKPDHPLGYALHRMIVCDLRYLPLVDAHDRPTGIISSKDIIAYIATKFQTTDSPTLPGSH